MSIVLNKKMSLNTTNTPTTSTTNTPTTSTTNTPATSTTNTPSSSTTNTPATSTTNTVSTQPSSTSTQPSSTSTQPTTTSITKNELKPADNSSGSIKIKNETKNISPEKLEEINKDYLTRLSNNPLQGIPNDKSKIKLPPKLQPQKQQEKPVESKLVQNPLLINNKIDMKVVGVGAPKLPRRSIVKPRYTIKDLEDKELKKKTIEILRNNVKKNEKNIFGKEEIKFQKEILNCTKLYLIEKKVLSKNGTIKNKDLVNKTKLWEYIMYIRSKNKNLTIFKDTLGKGNSVELYKLYLLVVKNVKERNLKDYKTSKDDLIKLIKIIIKQGPTLSFLKNYNPKTQSRKSPITKTKTRNNQLNNKSKISNIDITLKTNSGLERTTPQKANIKVDITKL